MESANETMMPAKENTKKGDFVEIKFTGYSQGQIFDSNIEEDLKKMQAKGNGKATVIVIGERMVVDGLDNALEGKEIGKEYQITLPAKEAFGERNRELLKTIPLKVFTEKDINPRPGLVLSLDDMVVKIIAVSGARVITDFNNPLSGKEVSYKFSIVRKVIDDAEKAKALFEFFFRFVPEFEIGEKITAKGPMALEAVITAFKDKFKELTGKELVFGLKEEKKKELAESSAEKESAEEGKSTGLDNPAK